MPTYEYAVRVPVSLETSRVRPDANNVLAEVRRMIDGALGEVARLGGVVGSGGRSGGGGIGGGRGAGGGFGGRDANDHVRVFREQQKEVERINRETARQAEAQARTLNRTLTQLEKQTADARIREQRRAADNFLRTLKESEAGAQRSAVTFSQLFGANFLGNLASRAVGQAVSAVIDTVGESFNRAASFEGLTRGLTAVTGSAQETERQLVRLKEAAKQPGLTFREAIEGTRNLQATGMASEFAERSVKAFGNALAIVGRNDRENLRGVLLAVQQIANTPFLQGDELRQLQERLPQVSKLLRDAFGTARSEELKEMGVSSERVLEAIVSGLEKLPRATGGALVAMEDLQDAWDQALVAFGSGFLEPVAAELVDIAGALERNQSAFREWGQNVGDILHLVRVAGESELGSLLSFIVRISPLMQGFRAFGELGRQLRGAPAAGPQQTDQFDAGNSVRVDPGTMRPRAVMSKEDRKQLEQQRDLVANLRRELQFFGDKSEVAATKQKLLAAGVTDLNTGLAAQAIQFAGVIDQMRDAAEVAEMADKKLKEGRENLEDQLKAVRESAVERARSLRQERLELSELSKFDFSPLVQTAQDASKSTGTYTELLKDAREAVEALDREIGDTRAWQERKKRADEVTSSIKQLNSTLEGLTNDLEDQVRGTRYFAGRRTPVDELFDSLSRMSELRDLQLPRTFFDQIHRFVADLGGLEAGEVDTLRTVLHALLIEAVPSEVGAQRVATLTDKIIQAIAAAQKAAAVLTPLQSAREALEGQLKDSQEAVSIAAETSALRYQLAWQEAFNEVALADDAARLSMIQSQARLSDMTVYHADQANAAVMDFLASQRSVTEVIADAKVGVIDSTFSAIDRGLDRATSKLGFMGSLVKDLLSGFIRLALSPFFQATMGGGGGFGARAQGAGGGIGSLLGGLFGGGGGFLTGGFAGGASPAAGLFGGLLAPAGISIPQGMTGASSVLTPDLRRQLALAALDSPNGVLPSGGLGGIFGQAGGALGGIAPLLGLTLGASLGGSSRAGNVLGGAGGLLGGLLGSSLLSGGGLGGMLGGTLGNLGGFLGIGAGALGAATFGIATAAMLVGSLILGRNAQRRRDEQTRNDVSHNTGTAIWDLIDRARTLTLSQARREWAQIEANYRQQTAQLKDSKTRRHAEKQWREDFAPLWNLVERGAREGEKAREFKSESVPTFAFGGDVARRFSDGGMMEPYSGRVPGRYDRKDDRIVRVSGDETILTPLHRARLGGHAAMMRAGVPGYADGVTLGGGSGVLPPMQFNFRVELGRGDRTRIVMEELRSAEGRAAIAAAVSDDVDREGMEGVLGAITLNLMKRGYVGG